MSLSWFKRMFIPYSACQNARTTLMFFYSEYNDELKTVGGFNSRMCFYRDARLFLQHEFYDILEDLLFCFFWECFMSDSVVHF